MRRSLFAGWCLAAALALGVLAQAGEAAALDGPQDRRGLFTGLGVGGGAAFREGGGAGGEAGLHAQLGGGAAKRLTLALDVDARLQLIDGAKTWLLAPGPQIDVFVIGGLFATAGVGLAFVFPDEELLPGEEFTFGFDGAVGLGYEFFVGSDLAIDLSVEGDFLFIDALPDAYSVGFWLGFRYY